MLKGVWGKKIGMTSIFVENKSVSVTVVDIGNWVVTGIKTESNDGYNAIQTGHVKKKYSVEQLFKGNVKKFKQCCNWLREIKVDVIDENDVVAS